MIKRTRSAINMFKKRLSDFLKKMLIISKKIKESKHIYRTAYRVVSIEQNKDGDYEIVVQIIGKNSVFKMKPEEILANDELTDLFSQRDIRTLTYLGYLDINKSKYSVLAKRLLEKDKKLVFAIKEKGNKKLLIKTAKEISLNPEMLSQMDQKDAHMVGYVSGTELMMTEEAEKQIAIKRLKK